MRLAELEPAVTDRVNLGQKRLLIFIVAYNAQTTIEKVLSRIAMLETPPVAIDLLIGEGWTIESSFGNQLVVRVEGTEQETAWLTDEVERTLLAAGCAAATPPGQHPDVCSVGPCS